MRGPSIYCVSLVATMGPKFFLGDRGEGDTWYQPCRRAVYLQFFGTTLAVLGRGFTVPDPRQVIGIARYTPLNYKLSRLYLHRLRKPKLQAIDKAHPEHCNSQALFRCPTWSIVVIFACASGRTRWCWRAKSCITSGSSFLQCRGVASNEANVHQSVPKPRSSGFRV